MCLFLKKGCAMFILGIAIMTLAAILLIALVYAVWRLEVMKGRLPLGDVEVRSEARTGLVMAAFAAFLLVGTGFIGSLFVFSYEKMFMREIIPLMAIIVFALAYVVVWFAGFRSIALRAKDLSATNWPRTNPCCTYVRQGFSILYEKVLVLRLIRFSCLFGGFFSC